MDSKTIEKTAEDLLGYNDDKINVFGYENNKSFVIYNSRNRSDVVIDLLLLKEENKNHFIWIKNFSRFIIPNGKCKNKLY